MRPFSVGCVVVVFVGLVLPSSLPCSSYHRRTSVVYSLGAKCEIGRRKRGGPKVHYQQVDQLLRPKLSVYKFCNEKGTGVVQVN